MIYSYVCDVKLFDITLTSVKHAILIITYCKVFDITC